MVIVDDKYRKIRRGNIVFVLVRFSKKYIFLILQFDVRTNSFDLGYKPITILGDFSTLIIVMPLEKFHVSKLDVYYIDLGKLWNHPLFWVKFRII